MTTSGAPVHRDRFDAYSLGKRLFDVVVSSVGLVLSAPLIAVISILTLLDSGGPVLYRQTRVGRFGDPFQLYKFRTMPVAADRIGPSSTADDDPRITRVGRLLRRFKLDELPQLINVLRGEMSFVGPRPQVPWAVALYTEEERAVLSVPPGVADYAFVMLPSEGEVLRGSADPDRDYLKKIHPHKMRLSLEYVRQRSFWFDIQILIDTALISFLGRPVFLRSGRRGEIDEVLQNRS